MLPRVLLPAALLLVAGCLGATDAPPLPGGGPGSAPAALAFEAAQQLPGDWISAEPNLAAGPDGQVWVVGVGSVLAAPGANVLRGAVNLWRSDDLGASWARLRDPGPQDKGGVFCSCDTDVDLGPDGALYLTDFWVGPNTNGFVVEASADGGATWGPGNPVTVTNVVGNDRQYITAGRDPGEVYLTYARGTFAAGVPDGGLHILRSTDGGLTFQPRAMPYQGRDMFIAKLRVGEDGTLYYPWLEGPGFDDPAVAVVAVSRDKGLTWERVEVAAVPHGPGGLWPLALDVGPDGLLHLVWMEQQPGGGSVLWYTRSADGAASFEAPRVVGWPGGTAVLPWIAHAGPGRAVIAYYGTPEAVVPLEAPEDQRWDAWALAVGASAAEDGAPTRASPWPVKVGVFCPQGAVCPHDRELLDYPGVIWRDGWVHVAFAASLEDEGAGPPAGAGAARTAAGPALPQPAVGAEPKGGHATNALLYVARAPLP